MKLKEIIKASCLYFEVNYTDITNKNRHQRMSEIRFHIWRAVRLYTPYTLQEIAKEFNRHHSSIMHGIGAHSDYLTYDKAYVIEWEHFQKHFYNNILRNEIHENKPIPEFFIREKALKLLELEDKMQVLIKEMNDVFQELLRV